MPVYKSEIRNEEQSWPDQLRKDAQRHLAIQNLSARQLADHSGVPYKTLHTFLSSSTQKGLHASNFEKLAKHLGWSFSKN